MEETKKATTATNQKKPNASQKAKTTESKKGNAVKQSASAKSSSASAKSANKVESAKEKETAEKRKVATAEKEKKQAVRLVAAKEKEIDRSKKKERDARRAKKAALKEEKKKQKLAEKQAQKAKKEEKKAKWKAEKAEKRRLFRAEKAQANKEKAQANQAKAEALAEKQKARAEKAKLREEKKALRAERKKQKLAEKQAQQRKNAAERKKQEQKRERAKEGAPREHRYIPNRGLTAAVIALGITTLALASALTVYRSSMEMKLKSLDGVYARAFYDLIGNVDEIDSNLSKLSVSSSAGMERSLLTDLTVEAEMAENSLSELPLSEECRNHAATLLNQIGDYARFLSRVLEQDALTEQQRETLLSLAQHNRALQQKLHAVEKTTQSGKMRLSSLLAKDENPLATGFRELGEAADALPKLIFDGPFSKGTENPKHAPRALPGKELDRVEAENALKQAFAAYGLTDITFRGEGKEGPITAYSFTAKDENGEDFYAQITKTGGKVLLFDKDCGDGGVMLGDDACIKMAETFLSELGVTDVTAVWTDSFGNECTVNFAAEEEGVICYPDLIKVKVCKTDGTVMGMEALSYYLNHKTRKDLTPTLSKAEAEALLSTSLSVTSSRLCVAPLGRGKETLCYEFVGTANGQTYYVYLSAKTGQEVQIFRVVEGTEGTLLS